MLRFLNFLIVFIPIWVLGKEVYFGPLNKESPEIKIRWEMLDPAYPAKGLKPTYLRFPKPVHRLDNASLFAVRPARVRNGNPDYRELVIYPRKVSGDSLVEIVLKDRTVIKVQMKISKQNHIPLSYNFRPQRVKDSKPLSSKKPSVIKNGVSELSVLRGVLENKIRV